MQHESYNILNQKICDSPERECPLTLHIILRLSDGQCLAAKSLLADCVSQNKGQG